MGLDGVSLRYFNIFGPRQDPSSPYSGVISLFTKFMSQGQRPMIYGDGRQTRDFTYVANAVAANLAAMRAPEPLGRRGLQRRHGPADQPAGPGRGHQPDLRHQPRTDLQAPRRATSGTRWPAWNGSRRRSATGRWWRSRKACEERSKVGEAKGKRQTGNEKKGKREK